MGRKVWDCGLCGNPVAEGEICGVCRDNDFTNPNHFFGEATSNTIKKELFKQGWGVPPKGMTRPQAISLLG